MADEENNTEYLLIPHADRHKDGGPDELLLHEFGEPTAGVPMNGQPLLAPKGTVVYHTSYANGSDSTGDGNPTNPYKTIQAVINATSGNITIFADRPNASESISVPAGRSISVFTTSPSLGQIASVTIASTGTLELFNILVASTITGAGNISMYNGLVVGSQVTSTGSIAFYGTIVYSASSLPSGVTGYYLDGDDSDVPLAINKDGNIDLCSTIFLTVGGGGNFSLEYFDVEGGRVAATHSGVTAGQWIIQFRLPDDFVSFKTNGVLIGVRRDGTTTSFTLTMLKNDVADSTISASSIMPTANLTFEEKTFTPGSSYSPGDVIIMEVDTTPGSPTVENQMCGIFISYNKKVIP